MPTWYMKNRSAIAVRISGISSGAIMKSRSAPCRRPAWRTQYSAAMVPIRPEATVAIAAMRSEYPIASMNCRLAYSSPNHRSDRPSIGNARNSPEFSESTTMRTIGAMRNT